MAITVKTYKYQGETYDCEYKIRQIFYSKHNTALPRNLLTAELLIKIYKRLIKNNKRAFDALLFLFKT